MKYITDYNDIKVRNEVIKFCELDTVKSLEDVVLHEVIEMDKHITKFDTKAEKVIFVRFYNRKKSRDIILKMFDYK